MTAPILSIIVPIYKVEAYLVACLNSLIHQQGLENAEFILIDDGSPDGCGAICDDYAIRDQRFRVIHKTNAGVSAARNSGLEIAKGRYVSFLDGDDFVSSDTYAENLSILEQDPSIDLIQFPYIFEYGRSENQPTFGAADRKIVGWKDFFSAWQTEGMTICNLWGNKIVRRERIKNTRFRTDLQGGEDGVFLLNIIQELNVFRLSSRGRMYYVYREGSYMNSTRSTKRTLDELYLLACRYELATQIPALEGRCRQNIYQLKQKYFHATSQVSKAEELLKIRQILDRQPYPPPLTFIKQMSKERKIDALIHLGMATLGMHYFSWICRKLPKSSKPPQS